MTTRKKKAPVNACQATKYHTKATETAMSRRANEKKKTGCANCSMTRASLETRLMVFPEMVSCKAHLLRERICKRTRLNNHLFMHPNLSYGLFNFNPLFGFPHLRPPPPKICDDIAHCRRKTMFYFLFLHLQLF